MKNEWSGKGRHLTEPLPFRERMRGLISQTTLQCGPRWSWPCGRRRPIGPIWRRGCLPGHRRLEGERGQHAGARLGEAAIDAVSGLNAVPAAQRGDVKLNLLSHAAGTAEEEALRIHASSPRSGSEKVLLLGSAFGAAGSFLGSPFRRRFRGSIASCAGSGLLGVERGQLFREVVHAF